MKKALVHGPRQLTIEDVPEPQLGERDVLVRIVRSSMCHTDVKVFLGEMPHLRFPRGLGHDASGVVEAVGPRVASVRPGDRVTLVAWGGCGECRLCRAGRTNACRVRPAGSEQDTAWMAEKVLKHERDLVLLPDAVSFEQAAFLEPLYTALNGQLLLGYGEGDTVVVVGTGSMGWGQIQVAALHGARVIGVDLLPERLELARHFGAQLTLLVGDPDLEARIEEICGPDGPEFAIDATGVAAGLELAMRLAGQGAGVGTLGTPTPVGLRPLVAKQLSLHGILNGFQKPLAVQLVAEGKIGLTDAISHRYPFARAADALLFAAENAAEASKVMLIHDGGESSG